MILKPPPSMPAPATIRPYDRPDAAQIIQTLAARAMGHRASMSGALTSGNLANLVRDDVGRAQQQQPGQPGGLNGFKMPLNPSFSFSGPTGQPGNSGGGHGHGHGRTGSQRMSFSGHNSHQRTGSASQSWNRQSFNGALGFGNNPPSLGAARLPTHSELSSGNPSRCTSSSGSNNDPIVVIDGSSQLKSTSASLSGRPSAAPKPRRESVTADKALREVEKALQGVEAQ